MLLMLLGETEEKSAFGEAVATGGGTMNDRGYVECFGVAKGIATVNDDGMSGWQSSGERDEERNE